MNKFLITFQTVGNIIKHKTLIIRRGVNFLLEEKRIQLTVTKTAREFLFEGYNDTLLTLLKKIHLKGIDIPFDKFGWFYNVCIMPLDMSN